MTQATSPAPPDSCALSLDPATGLVPATPPALLQLIGIDQSGGFYLYGDSGPGQAVAAVIATRILDVTVLRRGATSRFGERDYLSILMASPMPNLQHALRLPCSGSRGADGSQVTQHSVRSLLGALITLDLSATAVKLQPKRGHTTTFIEVLLHPTEYQPVIAPSIGPTRDDLEAAVDRCRVSLGLEPQFPNRP
jgi:hypothetical protein